MVERERESPQRGATRALNIHMNNTLDTQKISLTGSTAPSRGPAVASSPTALHGAWPSLPGWPTEPRRRFGPAGITCGENYGRILDTEIVACVFY